MNESITNGGPAFLFAKEMETIQGLQFSTGMSLRDYFAGQALAGLCANADHIDSLDNSDKGVAGMAAHATKLADAMIMARNQHQ